MPIDPNIAMGVRPVEQPNVLGQMAQVMAMRQAQQEYENEGGLRNALTGGLPDDPSSLLKYGKQGRAVYESALKGRTEQLKSSQSRIDMMGGLAGFVRERPTPENFESSLTQAVSYGLMTPAQKQQVITQYGGSPESIKAYADQSFQNALTAKDRTANETRIQAANIGAGPAYARLNYDIKNPTQHFFTGEDNTLMSVPTRGGGAATSVPMAGASVLPPQITVGGGGAGSSIMNPTSVNGLAPLVQNGLITQPQPAPSAPGFAKVRQPPNAVTNVNTFIPASETAQIEFMKGSRATYDQLKTASTVLDNIEKAKALIPTAKGFMGTGGETMLEAAKFMNNRLGTSIDTTGIKSAEELNTRAFMGILDNLKKLDAQPSQSQQAALKQALGSLSTDPSAMSAVLDVFGDIVRTKVDIYNQEVTGAEARGIKFPYNPVIKLQGRTPANTGDIATDAGVAKVIKSNAEYDALPSGATFTAPDRTTRRKP